LFIHGVGSEDASATVSRSCFKLSLWLDQVLLAAGMTWDRQLHLEANAPILQLLDNEDVPNIVRHMPSSKMWQCRRKAVLPIEFTSAFGGNAGLATEAWQRQRHTVIKSAGPCGSGLCDDMGFYRY
jgi:hypothetical protein